MAVAEKQKKQQDTGEENGDEQQEQQESSSGNARNTALVYASRAPPRATALSTFQRPPAPPEITPFPLCVLAVIVPGSAARPHFVGAAYIRDGTKSVKASERLLHNDAAEFWPNQAHSKVKRALTTLENLQRFVDDPPQGFVEKHEGRYDDLFDMSSRPFWERHHLS